MTVPSDANPEIVAAFLLKTVDESPDRLAVIDIPAAAVKTDQDVDTIEQTFMAAFDIAKAERPDLSVKVVEGPSADVPVQVAVHEHQWVGEQCIRGCGTPYPHAA